ncbi:GNAT family N-acetyltransferase [Aliiglaciecola sp. CAU 1673]|uniref:GNAT family N-acetyltransferase n=1 Tax=Aliiglaciecola sp. CAU 1673 TaxID=3032595 RepID=UPI0023DCBF3B|nr:GNAT family N-acetyltransferase [Aliiglaciecola sp. CAU 1673]MDF2177244.1 GNAT family N-acetyltransferase [Aliiglaciecola sp. CAU 1673]
MLISPRLSLQPLEQSHWHFFYSLHQQSQLLQFVCDPLDDTQIRHKFERKCASLSSQGAPQRNWLISERTSHEPVGVIGLVCSEDDHKQAEVGFILSSQFQGKGYGLESLKTVLEYAFDNQALEQVLAKVIKDNHPSQMLLGKAGFFLQKELSNEVRLNGKWLDEQIFTLSHEQWRLHNALQA